MPAIRILAVDDDPDIRSLLEDLLGEAGYEVKAVASAFQARGAIAKWTPHLVLLDRALPDAEGLELLGEMRSQAASALIPVLFLTAKGRPADKAEGLRAGGDDYLAKPFNSEELLARVEALLRRCLPPPAPSRVLRAKGLMVDLERHEASVDGRPVHLPPKEFELLAALMEGRNRVLSRRYLLERVWGAGNDLEMNTKTVDVAVGRLRAALGGLGRKIVAVQSYGYRLDLDD